MYSGPGGLQEEFTQIAAQNPKITKLFNFGKTVNGQNILALKVSKNARTTEDGRKPAVLYLGAQHAREWITPEMIRRLAHYFVDNYASNSSIRRLVDDNELWFVPVANPDGYDFTFQDGQRLWRKNLRDNNNDGVIEAGDGVDLNRNLPTKWGYDNEGSSPEPTSETYRGPGPASEPETKAIEQPGPPRRLRVLRQLPLGGRAAALRPRLAGRDAVARRRPLRGDGRRRRQPGDPRLRPGHLRRAVHDQRRHRHRPAGALQDARLHAGDGRRASRPSAIDPDDEFDPRTVAAASSSPTARR